MHQQIGEFPHDEIAGSMGHEFNIDEPCYLVK